MLHIIHLIEICVHVVQTLPDHLPYFRSDIHYTVLYKQPEPLKDLIGDVQAGGTSVNPWPAAVRLLCTTQSVKSLLHGAGRLLRSESFG